MSQARVFLVIDYTRSGQALSAHANACVHYEARKRHVAKQSKTLAANEQALKAAEKKALQQLQQVGARAPTGVGGGMGRPSVPSR
jgi:hypothetical protein